MSSPILAIDLDGTLLRDDKTVSDFTIETLQSVSKTGAQILFATGRRERISIPVLKSFNFKSRAIYDNGMLAVDWPSQRRIFSNYIPKNLILKVIHCLKEIARPPVLFMDSEPGKPDILMDKSLLSIEVYREYSETHKDFSIIEENIAESKHLGKIVGIFLSEPLESVPEIRAHLTNMLEEVIEHRALDNLLYRPHLRIIEILQPGHTKWNGISELKKMIGGLGTEVIAFGDDHNDIDMLANADRSFAPESAIKAAKEAADEIIGSNNEDGVAKKLKELFLC